MDGSDISASYLSQFRVHIAQVQAHLAGQTQDPLLPSISPPTAYWTSSEKNSFFRALARYSRVRPDLIAAHIKTKSVVDVCAYLDLLHAASKDNPIFRARTDIEIAFEVSGTWVEYEERNATSLTTAELLWDTEQRRTSRQAQVAKKRDDLETPEIYDNWRAEAEAQWSREDSLRCLDALQLDALESILRTGDPALTSNHANDAQDSDRQDTSQGVSLDPGPDITETIGDTHIDSSPSPNASSPLSNVFTINTEQITSNPRGDDLQSTANMPVHAADQISTEQGVTTAPRDALTPNSPSPQVAPGALSPASRRRLQKRFYMRRKRAGQSGGEVNYTVTKLLPGRKKIERQTEDYKEQKRTKRHKISGLTRPYKIRQQFAEQQINLTELQRTGLDLFHLSALSRLIELYKSGYAEAEENAVTSISADTIYLLRSIVVAFTTEIIYRAIVLKSQEFQRKGDIKVWRLGEKEISADAIQSCLKMMGFDNLTKRAYFDQLLAYQSESDELSTDESEAEGSGEVDDRNVSESDNRTNTNQLSPAFILSLQDAIPLFPAELEDDTSLMPMDTDDDGLRKELKEEEELDQVDEASMEQYESELWEQEI